MTKMLTPMKINPDTLDFDLPNELIAQEALEKRDQARLMVVDRASHECQHQHFFQLPQFINPGDILVLNQAKVNPSKVIGKKMSGGRVELIFIAPSVNPQVWSALVRPELKEGTLIQVGDSIQLRHVGRTATGENLIDLNGNNLDLICQQYGEIPLPPYIKRDMGDKRSAQDRDLYQTVYAESPGSIAAPTAGLHFTDGLLSELKNKGVTLLKLTLHVGWGTFKPVSNLSTHTMLSESYEISAEVWRELKKARQDHRRIIAVGTTATRVLESLSGNEPDGPLKGATDIFIRPGFQFKWISALITNFHVPKSTPISLVSALAGLPMIERAYAQAIEHRYRFFSYGDAMLIQ